MKIYFAADHAGFELKNELVAFVKTLGHEAEDHGAFTFDKDDDYPEFIAAAARALAHDAAAGLDSRAVVIGASGQGEAIVANRFHGVRCALYYGAPTKEQTDMSGNQLDMLSSTREHNNANAISLGARFLTADEAKTALEKWLNVGFTGEERHVRRIKQIDDAT
ncbi:MAG: hypothetical protein RLZZ416_738 [Candidatus Parcubacteria bacterium]